MAAPQVPDNPNGGDCPREPASQQPRFIAVESKPPEPVPVKARSPSPQALATVERAEGNYVLHQQVEVSMNNFKWARATVQGLNPLQVRMEHPGYRPWKHYEYAGWNFGSDQNGLKAEKK